MSTRTYNVYELNIGNSLLGIDDGNNCVNVNVTWMSGSEESRVVLKSITAMVQNALNPIIDSLPPCKIVKHGVK